MDAKKLKKLRLWATNVPLFLGTFLLFVNITLSLLFDWMFNFKTKVIISTIIIAIWLPFIIYDLVMTFMGNGTVLRINPDFMPNEKDKNRHIKLFLLIVFNVILVLCTYVLFVLLYNH